jgi:hypothetical protein
VTGWFWPTAEVRQDEYRGAGMPPKAASHDIRVIISATDPQQPFGIASRREHKLEAKDGEIDYTGYSLSELRDVEAHIDSHNNPKNFANLMQAIDNLVEQQESEPQPAPEIVSGKSPAQIGAEYEIVLKKQKLTTLVVLVLWAPKLIAGFFDTQTFLGISESIWLVVYGVGLLILLWFLFFVFKCPNCSRSPGGGWSRQNCKFCGVFLRGTG